MWSEASPRCCGRSGRPTRHTGRPARGCGAGTSPSGPDYRRGPLARPSEFSALLERAYLSSTVAPASSSCALTESASSWFTPSLTAFGAPSTRSFASFRPRPVTARTTLITWIFCWPALVRTTSKKVFSSATAAPSPPPAAPPGAATATGAAAVMPHSSSIFFFSSTSSSTVMLPSCSKTVSTAAIVCLLLGFGFLLVFLLWRALRSRRLPRDGSGLRRAQLLDAGVDQAVQVLQRRVHQREQLVERRDHGAD